MARFVGCEGARWPAKVTIFSETCDLALGFRPRPVPLNFVAFRFGVVVGVAGTAAPLGLADVLGAGFLPCWSLVARFVFSFALAVSSGNGTCGCLSGLPKSFENIRSSSAALQLDGRPFREALHLRGETSDAMT